MTISSLRSFLYRSARLLGDVQAINRAFRTRSAKPINNRIIRRITGRMAGKLLGRWPRG